MEFDLIAPAVGSPFRSSIVHNSKPLEHPYAHPVALYSSKDYSFLGYRIGISDRAQRPGVPWIGLQSVIDGVLVADLEDWEKAVKEHLGEYIADG